jgi:hypothetical protein
MKTKALLAAAVLLLATRATAGEVRGTCEIRFVGTSTLHDFSGNGRCRPFSAPLVRTPEGGTVLPLVELEIPVEEMKTGIGARDERMREMFHADRHPGIHAAARGIDADPLRGRMRADREGKAPIGITLAIGGVERAIQATAGNLREDGNRVFFEIEFPVSLKEFGLAAPTVLGIIRVGDRVAVKGIFVLDVSEAPR